MTEIYLDVLVGLNLYITWALFHCCELLGHFRAKTGRKALASLLGGLSSLLILLPDLQLLPLLLLRMGLAALLTLTAFGWSGRKAFTRQVLLFFFCNFLFAGVMIACWLLFTPPGMAIRNGVVYLHLSALTLILSTIAASLAVRGLSALFWRRKPRRLIRPLRIAVDGKELVLQVFLDTGNRLCFQGMPVLVCTGDRLRPLLPSPLLAAAEDLSALAALPEGRWKQRLRMVPCETAAGSRLLPAFLPDRLTREDGVSLRALIALTCGSFWGGEADAAAPPELWQDCP
ncbi:MAG: sigma-E processing peptidase SpoIIGA [Oscillospiraceae bacterium]|nr:sigma-E processing peptidase SpoIIGA [Oscillospiraceae bacterium]